MKHVFFQQGDVKIHKLDGGFNGLDKMPDGVKQVVAKPLALGEATGHHHSVCETDTSKFTMYEDNDGVLYLKVVEPVTVEHQEHGVGVIAEGEYVIDIVHEYDHFTEEAKKVSD